MDFVIPYLRGYPSLIHYPSLTCNICKRMPEVFIEIQEHSGGVANKR
jgi:hypothetical protein